VPAICSARPTITEKILHNAKQYRMRTQLGLSSPLVSPLTGTLSGGRRLIFLPIGTVLFQFSADRAWGSTQGSRNRSHRRPVPHHQHDRSVARSSGLKKWLYEFFHRNILPQQVLRSILARALQVFPFCNITLQESKLINWNLPSPRKRVSKKEYSI